ncbi:type II toxin-antitoxin system RelE/ParE family toxin [Microbacterium istanbulense]|uniref:Type II toxin-antitoxin system RelE/ParE family toxin n=1 Tax=Microbacterium istanbulense TaxID=3122049 RepID=A0ABU8LJF1_9MICO
MSLPLRRRSLADADVEDAVAWYISEAGPDVALDLVDDIERAYELIAQNPGIGSMRIGLEIGIPALRTFTLERFPYAIFTMEYADRVEVWRVLHTSRDLGSLLNDE